MIYVILYFFMGLVCSFFSLRALVKYEGSLDSVDIFVVGVVNILVWPFLTPILLFSITDFGSSITHWVERVVSVGMKRRK